ncbi:MAG: histidine ammonia-lyase [Pseudomonadota bacterium]
MTEALVLSPGGIGFDGWRRVMAGGRPVALDPACWPGVEASASAVAEIVRAGRTVYGINTGFGSLATTRISPAEIEELQRRLVLSHSVGVGPLLPDPVVRLVLALKAASLARGYSGIRRLVIEALLKLLNADVLPCIPAKGSVGASGDLAPLAHLAAVLLGFGAVRASGSFLPAAAGLRRAGLAPITLAAKEGLAFLNGTQVSSALALVGLFAAEDAFAAALVAGALSVDAALGSDTPFDPRIQAVRGQSGQIAVARALVRLLAGSAIRASHLACERVQDPYSLRCQPQVMGACLDHMEFAAGVFLAEANGVSDNPLVFAPTGDILSGGNFHAEPVAMAADVMALALAEIGNLSERRIALLVDARMSGLPPFLVRDPGLNSGFMAAQVTAAALASENKAMAHPASVDSIPTVANQEDHVSMATFAARRLAEMADNVTSIVAIELLAAAQGIEFRRPLATSAPLERALAAVRERVAALDVDRQMAPDIEAVRALIAAGWFQSLVPMTGGAIAEEGPESERR